jgi:hypothetical protein
MIRLLVRPMLASVFVFAALVGVIRAQPYDDSELRAILTPLDCPMPCFMGIRPGVTPIEEAVMILTAHEWATDVRVFYNRGGRLYQAQWAWSGQQPAFIDGSKLSYIYAQDGIVETINTETTVPFGNLWLILGTPDRGNGHGLSRRATFVFHNAGYLRSSLGIQSVMRCPIHLRNIFETTVTISFIADMDTRFSPDHYRLSDWVDVQPCAPE